MVHPAGAATEYGSLLVRDISSQSLPPPPGFGGQAVVQSSVQGPRSKVRSPESSFILPPSSFSSVALSPPAGALRRGGNRFPRAYARGYRLSPFGLGKRQTRKTPNTRISGTTSTIPAALPRPLALDLVIGHWTLPLGPMVLWSHCHMVQPVAARRSTTRAPNFLRYTQDFMIDMPVCCVL